VLKGDNLNRCSEKENEALEMAIQALEQEPTDEYMCGYNKGFDEGVEEGIKATVEPCEDAVSRKEVIRLIRNENSALKDIFITHSAGEELSKQINELPSVTPGRGWEEMTVPCENCGHDMTFKIAVCGELNTGHCKECKYFEYDSVAKVDGIPLIVAHEICNKWGDGCKTKEDGYCFLFEPRESEVNNE